MSYKTLILIDNSKTLTTLNREIIKETVKYLIKNSNENTYFGIATVSDKTTMLADFEDTKETKLRSLDELEYVESPQSVRDSLMEVITEYKDSDFAKREIILISDGNSRDGLYTTEELYFELNNSSYPVYVLCCDQNDNTVDLRGISSFARISGGKSFHTQFEGDDSSVEVKIGEEIISALDEYRSIYREGDFSVDFIETSGSGGTEEMVIPTNVNSEIYYPYDESNNYENVNDEYNESSVIYEQPDNKNTGKKQALLSVSIVVFLIILFLIIQANNRKKRRQEKEKEEWFLNTLKCSLSQNGNGHYENKFDENNSNGTRCLNEDVDDDEDGGTRLLYQAMDGVDITLEDRADPTKYVRATVVDKLIIGRVEKLCDIPLPYDDSISGKHCEIFLRGSDLYVRDLSSSNGTYVNGQKVYQELKISSGDILKLGQVGLYIQILRRN